MVKFRGRTTMTDDERMAAYEDCIRKSSATLKNIGERFVGKLLEGEWDEALQAWADMLIEADKASPRCSDVLTPEQKALVRERIVARRKAEREDRDWVKRT
jgi:hypothetical protein